MNMYPTPDMSTHVLVTHLRTGNVLVDLVIAAIVVSIVGWCTTAGKATLRAAANWVHARWAARFHEVVNRTEMASRAITYTYNTRHPDHGGDATSDAYYNRKLQVAIMWHINTLQPMFRNAVMALTEVGSTPRVATLEGYEVTCMPQNDYVYEVAPGITFCQFVSDNKKDNDDWRTITFRLTGPSVEQVDAFVRTAFNNFRAMRSKAVDTTRYVFYPVKFGAQRRFRRYPVDTKTFDSMFFEGKADLLRLLKDFKKCKGRFAIDGFPHKLGFLLHGPPGTGKTTFVKALASFLCRHVIMVPLGEVPDNDSLFRLMNDNSTLQLDGEDVVYHLKHKDVIYFFDDVDASSPVVTKRVAKELQPAVPYLPWFTSSPVPGKEKEKKPDSEDTSAAKEPLVVPMFQRPGPTLDCLLNILDGLLNTSNRVVVMCTNHPEKLDPALVRPGRMSTHILFGPIDVTSAVQMLEHYYPDSTVGEDGTTLLTRFVDEIRPTPARLESMCSKHDTLRALLDALPNETADLCEAPPTPVVPVVPVALFKTLKVPKDESDDESDDHRQSDGFSDAEQDVE